MRERKRDRNLLVESYFGYFCRTLLSMLSLMSKLANHRGLYCNDQLQSLYMKVRLVVINQLCVISCIVQLLMSPEVKIQKLSLSCLKNYKKPYLNPY